MDPIKQQKFNALTKFKRCHHLLEGAFQIFLSITLFSLFCLSYSSSLPPTTNFPKPFKPFLTSFISSYLSFEANRSLMFLICNVILVFVTGGFGYFFRVSSNAAEDIHGEYLARSAAHHLSVPVEDKEVIVESIVLAKSGATDIEVEDGQDDEDDGGGEEEEEATIDDGADQENHYHQHHLCQPYHHRQSRPHHGHLQLRVQVEEEENEEENYRLQQQKQDKRGGLVVIEESDERFDNFIKQVREAMRMETKQLLLTA